MVDVSTKRVSITRRAVLLSMFVTLPFLVIFSRLYFLQVISANRYRRLSDKNSISNKIVLPGRGRILDRLGRVIAFNKRVFKLNIIPEQTKNLDGVLGKINKLIGLTDYEIRKVKERIKDNPKFYSIPVKEYISFKEATLVEFNVPSLSGVYVEVGLERYYPYHDVGSHLLGYVAEISKESLSKYRDAMFKVPGFKIGKRGIEEFFNKFLIGKSGLDQLEVNATGRSVKQIAEFASKDGKDVNISLDYKIQELVKDKLTDHVGSLILMNAKTGEVLAAVSNPSFDNNDFVFGIQEDDWNKLLENPKRPLLNRALNGQYAPASTFKIVVATAALMEGVIDEDFKVTCHEKTKFGRRWFHCWKKGGHGTLNLPQAIAASCDIYFYELGKKLGVDNIAKYAKMFGLGDSLDFELFNSKGIVPTKLWKRIRTKTPWQGGDDLVTAIGQGYLLASPLQLATMTARVGTGKLVEPTLKLGGKREFKDLDIKPEVLKVVQKGMDMVVNDMHYGTAFYKRSRKFRIWGKTGTAQVISKRFDKDTKIEDIPYEHRNNALYVGFYDHEKHPLAISLVLEHAGSGGKAAAIANRLLEKIVPLVEEYDKKSIP
ncbi:MAG: penicillin-binding protein 2 [Proteobacteria bacterium]|nr:penicillin-binding protein 2 [Pseudomonadota bacterium]